MGTNFYMMTTNKEIAHKDFRDGYVLTDEPEFGYLIHIAKTSAGWKPLFQSYDNIHSVADIKKYYDKCQFKILDEYNKEYNWESFKRRVLDFGNREDALSHIYIRTDIPDYKTYYGDNFSTNYFFADKDGYEFTKRDFS